MEKEDYLPLFISSDDPIVVYVVDNKLVDFDILGGAYYTSPKYPYYLLGKLATNPKTMHSFPKKILQQHLDFFDDVDVAWPCLSGILFEGCNRCLSVSMDIQQTHDAVYVHFKDFAYIASRDGPFCSVSDLDSEITLLPKDAFLLLANICVGGSLVFSGMTSNDFPNNLKMIKNRINDRYDTLYQEHVKDSKKGKYAFQKEFKKSLRGKYFSLFHFYPTDLFKVDYLVYLKEELLAKRLTPEKILWLSGVNILAFFSDIPVVKTFIDNCLAQFLESFDELSLNEKICFGALFLLCAQDYESRFPTLAQYSENNNEFLWQQAPVTLLEKEFKEKLFRPSGKETCHDVVYLKYLGRRIY